MADNASAGSFIELTAEIVSAYVSNNSVAAADLSALINQVHAALTRVSSGQHELSSEPLKPAIAVKKSIAPDYIVCLEDGKKFKSLKRHLRTPLRACQADGPRPAAPPTEIASSRTRC
jgi:predicted transcriptional regulator